MSDLIDRQQAIRNICDQECHQSKPCKWKCIAIDEIEDLPSVQPDVPDTNVGELISRQEAIKAILGEPPEVNYPIYYAEKIRELPSVHPRKGKWLIYSTFDDCYYAKCDQCHETQVFYYNKPLTNFCPNCGCRMEEGDSDDL